MVREVRQTKSKEQKGFGLPNCVLAFAKSISISYLKPFAWLPREARWLLFGENLGCSQPRSLALATRSPESSFLLVHTGKKAVKRWVWSSGVPDT